MRELTRARFARRRGGAPRRVGWWLLIVASAVGAVRRLEGPRARLARLSHRRHPTALVLTVPLAVAWWWLLRIPQLWARIATSAAVAAIVWGALVAAGVYALPVQWRAHHRDGSARRGSTPPKPGAPR